MSRKITNNAINAFIAGSTFNGGNTAVKTHSGITIMYLHGHEIARKNWNGKNEIEITNCGFFTNTTKERLNGIPNVSIYQKKGKWYLNGQEWNGKLTKVS